MGIDIKFGEKNKPVIDLLKLGTDIVGGMAAGAIGFYVGGLPGAVVAGASRPTISTTLMYVAEEVKHRWLSPRQKERIGATMAMTLSKIENNICEGKFIREDSFFAKSEGLISSAEAVAEAVFTSALNEYQEKKLQYYAKFLGNLYCDPTISSADAFHLIKLAQQLSYRQILLISLFVDGDRSLRNEDYRALQDFRTNHADDLMLVLQEIYDMYNWGVVHAGEDHLLGYADVTPAKMSLAESGIHFYGLMELMDVPDKELDALEAILQF